VVSVDVSGRATASLGRPSRRPACLARGPLPCQGGRSEISTTDACRPAPSELVVRVVECQREADADRWSAPEMLIPVE
jgi:hypothetical protein